jgi:hypothetical protein
VPDELVAKIPQEAVGRACICENKERMNKNSAPKRIVCLSAEAADWLCRIGAWEQVPKLAIVRPPHNGQRSGSAPTLSASVLNFLKLLFYLGSRIAQNQFSKAQDKEVHPPLTTPTHDKIGAACW